MDTQSAVQSETRNNSDTGREAKHSRELQVLVCVTEKNGKVMEMIGDIVRQYADIVDDMAGIKKTNENITDIPMDFQLMENISI